MLYDANERGQNHQHVVSLGRLLHANVFSSSVALVLIFPNPGPSTVAASHSGNSMFVVAAATSVTTSFICNCETEVVPLQTLHSMLPPPPPPPSATTSLVCTYETGVVSLQHSHATLPPPPPAPPSHPTERWSTSIRSHVSGTVQLICCSQLSKDFIDNICTLNTL